MNLPVSSSRIYLIWPQLPAILNSIHESECNVQMNCKFHTPNYLHLFKQFLPLFFKLLLVQTYFSFFGEKKLYLSRMFFWRVFFYIFK